MPAESGRFGEERDPESKQTSATSCTVEAEAMSEHKDRQRALLVFQEELGFAM